jgi:hypothetical protein
MSGALFGFFLLVGLLLTVGLYVAIERETSNTTVMDRAEAERTVQQRSGPGRARRRSDGSERTESGTTQKDEDDWDHNRLDGDTE